MSKQQSPKKGHILPHGEGSFYHRESDNRWVGTIEAGWNANGKRRRITVSDRDENKAWAKLLAKKKQIFYEGTPSEAAKESTTVRTWVDRWLDDRQSQVKPKTHNTDSGLLNKWVVPTIGQRRITDLDANDIRKIVQGVRKAGLSETTAGHAVRVFKQCMKDAAIEGHRVPAPVLQARKPAPAQSDRGAMTEAQALKFRRWSQRPDHLERTRWEFALMTACRQGEALGLRWSDLDLENHTVTLRWALQELTRDKTTGDYYVPPKYRSKQLEGRFFLLGPKTRAGVRTVPLPLSLCERLEEWKQVGPSSPHGLVWPRPDGKPALNRKDREEFAAVQEALSIRHVEADRLYTPHELRHTTVSLLIALGVPVAVIEAIVGHSKLVKDYVHVSEGQAREGIDLYDRKLIAG